MKRCSNCGAESGDEAQFCQKCGNTLTAGTYGRSMLYTPYVPPQKKDNTGLILAVVIVVILAIGLVVAAFVVTDAMKKIPWEEWADYNVDMSVNSQEPYLNPSDLPENGYKYVRLSVTISNDRVDALTLEPDRFLLYTSDNQYFGYATAVPDNVPASIDSGDTTTFVIGFMIPEDSVPSVLKMDIPDDMFGSVSAVVPS